MSANVWIFCGNFSLAIASYFFPGPMCALIWVFKLLYCIMSIVVDVSVFSAVFDMKIPEGYSSFSDSVWYSSGMP